MTQGEKSANTRRWSSQNVGSKNSFTNVDDTATMRTAPLANAVDAKYHELRGDERDAVERLMQVIRMCMAVYMCCVIWMRVAR